MRSFSERNARPSVIAWTTAAASSPARSARGQRLVIRPPPGTFSELAQSDLLFLRAASRRWSLHLGQPKLTMPRSAYRCPIYEQCERDMVYAEGLVQRLERLSYSGV